MTCATEAREASPSLCPTAQLKFLKRTTNLPQYTRQQSSTVRSLHISATHSQVNALYARTIGSFELGQCVCRNVITASGMQDLVVLEVLAFAGCRTQEITKHD